MTPPIFHQIGDERQFSLLSRGDRIWARWRGWDQPRQLLFLTPNGDAGDAISDQVLATWSKEIGVIVFDLPLTGRRQSDKLSRDTLPEDWEEQIHADIQSILACVGLNGDRIKVLGTPETQAIIESLEGPCLCLDGPASADDSTWFAATLARLGLVETEDE